MAEISIALKNRVKESLEDKICWDQIMGIAVPFINSKGNWFAELKMLKKTIFKKHMQVLSDSIFESACPSSETPLLYKITAEEKAILDKINIDCDNFFSSTPYCVDSTFLLRKDDVVQFYELFETIYQTVVNKDINNSKCGFMQIDNSPTPVPFVEVADVGLVVPLFFFESAKVSKIAFLLKDYWLVTYLKLYCKLLTILPNFYDHKTLWVVELRLLKTVVTDLKELRFFRSLPPNAKTGLFLRQEKITKTEPNKTKCPGNEKIDTTLDGTLKTTQKRHSENIKPSVDFISAEKMLKLSNTVTIKHDNECDDEFVEEIITIKIESLEPEIDKLEECGEPNHKILETYADKTTIKEIKKLSQIEMCAPKPIRMGRPPIIGNVSTTSANTSKPLNKTRLPEIIVNNNKSSIEDTARKIKRSYVSRRIKNKQQQIILNDTAESLSTSTMPQSKASTSSTYVPAVGTFNGPNGSIPRPVGNMGYSTDILGQSLLRFSTNLPTIPVQTPQSRSLVNLSGVMIQKPEQQAGTMIITTSGNNPGIYTMAQQSNTMSSLQHKPHTSLALCSSSTYVNTSNMSSSLSHSSMLIHPSGLPAHTQNVIPEPLLSGTLMQKDVEQSGPITHQTRPEFVTRFTRSRIPSSMVQQSNIMAATTENIAHEKRNVPSQELYLPQGPHTSLINSDSNPVELLHIPNSIAKSLIFQNKSTNSSEVMKNALKFQEPQSIPKNKLDILRRLKESSSDSRFVNILPKPSNKPEIARPELSTNTFSSNTVENIRISEVIASPSINCLPFMGTTNNVTNLNNALILQPNNPVHGGIMTNAFPSNVLNSSVINCSPQNGIITVPGMISYQNGFLGNMDTVKKAQNSLQLLNSSGFVINSILGSPNCVLTPQPNMASIQNLVMPTSNYNLVVCPISCPLPEQVPQTHNMLQPTNIALLNNNYAARQNNSMISKMTDVEQLNDITFSIKREINHNAKLSKVPESKNIYSTNSSNLNQIYNDNDLTFGKNGNSQSGVVVAHLNDLMSYSSNMGDRVTHEDSASHDDDDIKMEFNNIQNSFSIDANNASIKKEQNDNIVNLNTQKLNNDVIIKTESDDLDVKPKDCSLEIIDLTDEDVFVPSKEHKTDPCTIISDEDIKRLVMFQGMGREVLYKVNEISNFDLVEEGTYKVVNIEIHYPIKKLHSFFCISKNPLNHDDLLISVKEIVAKLFPHLTPKTFMAIANEMKLEVFSLNETQKTVLQLFYVINKKSDVSGYLYFLYKKFIVCYAAIRRISKMFLKNVPAEPMKKIGPVLL